MAYTVRILDAVWVTHDVRRLTVEKPDGYEFVPGQATDVAVDNDTWRAETRPFTFTSLNAWPHLEFTIKTYPDHRGVTDQIGKLSVGDRLILQDPWGAIKFLGNGCFIAGGAGITPFIAILRDLQARGKIAGNMLVFSNKTEQDIILRSELTEMEGLDCLFMVTRQPKSKLAGGRIDSAFLKKHISDFSQHFYVCGPEKMVESVSGALRSLGANAEAIVFEK
jgi:propane monooxygenase reductase component